jgi:23S rRNA pseudouridine2457 synthase
MPQYRYFLFHKPFQVLSQFSKEGDKQTLADYFPQLPKDIYPVGRLDWNSEGLMLLTNDKRLTTDLLNPTQKHPRTYWVQVEGDITSEALQQLQQGVMISLDGKASKTLPALAEKFDQEPYVAERNPPVRYRASIPTSWIALTLTEGKNRQVRRMTAAVGFPTLRLIRWSIGSATLAGMEPGESIEVTGAIREKVMKR